MSVSSSHLACHLLSIIVATLLLHVGAVHASGVPDRGTWETTLLPRDINGDGTVDAFYDTTLNISWLDDASLSRSDPMTWPEAMSWAAGLNVYSIKGWRLPMMIDTGAPGCDWSLAGGTDCGQNVQTISADGLTVYSEMAHLFYISLGNLAACTAGVVDCDLSHPQPGYGLTNTGGFRYLQAQTYWTGLALPLGVGQPTPSAWHFGFAAGDQLWFNQDWPYIRTLAVHTGDVSAVPELRTGAMLLTGLGGLAAALRRRAVGGLGESSAA